MLNAARCRHLLGEHFEPTRTCSVAPETLVVEEKRGGRGWDGDSDGGGG